MCGIEIHQRLATSKLFCNCPSILRDDEPHFRIIRTLRAVAGETGVVDAAARHEHERDIYFVYEGYNDTTCLVELDEEPPHPLNNDALKVALQVCKMIGADIVDEIQVMRKTVVNGSNTSGFQRTALIATGGVLETSEGKVGIPTISIEEESAKDITKGTDKHGRDFVTYRLDRLGIPLVEIGTDPDIKTPEQCKETSEKIGMILRSTGKVARGIGTIRQDINISVRGGKRIEIKGAQDLKMIPTWVDYEARRQLALIGVAKKVAHLEPKDVEPVDVSRIFKGTGCKFIKSALVKDDVVLGIPMPGFEGILGIETSPSKRIGSELSDYAKIKAGVGGIIHSDEKMDKYNFTQAEIESVKSEVGCSSGDAFILVVAPYKKAVMAIKAAVGRASRLKEGVLMEVRKPNADGTSSFMRPIPGSARMYPETDIPTIRPDTDDIKLPELLEDKKERYIKEFGVSKDLARDLTKGPFALFEKSVEKYDNIKPAFVGDVLISVPKNLRRKFKVDTDNIQDSDFDELFRRLDSGLLVKDSIEPILFELAKGNKVDYSRYEPLSDEVLRSEVKRLLEENKALKPNQVIGKVMGSLKGKADGKKLMGLIQELRGSV